MFTWCTLAVVMISITTDLSGILAEILLQEILQEYLTTILLLSTYVLSIFIIAEICRTVN